MTVFLSCEADTSFSDALLREGHRIYKIAPRPGVEEECASHPDITITPLGQEKEAPLAFADKSVLRLHYPEVAAWNALFLDKYMLYSPGVTHPFLLEKARQLGKVPIAVKQGYIRCNTLPVDGKHMITSDPSILKALREIQDISVLPITPGGVLLGNGAHYGFIGGTGGRIGRVVWFHGNLSQHPDGASIRSFCREAGYEVKEFSFPLRDIGSVIATEIPPDELESLPFTEQIALL